MAVGITAPVAELDFVQLRYEPAGPAFSLVLEYEGHTRVDGEFRAPAVLLSRALADPYAALRWHREQLVERGDASAPRARRTAAWWTEPIFCGWGAQCHLAVVEGRPPSDFATQAHYDTFLAELQRHGLVPGTIVVDDKWQRDYGTCAPDPAKWPDLAAWIAERRSRGQHVLLWWKAWDPEGLPPELCVRNADGTPVALDPYSPGAREALCEIVAGMLAPDGLGADGLKVDFTARTPSGRALSSHGGAWGIALLHRLIEIVYGAAKSVKPDGLVITHAPHPAFADVSDMIRLNDMVLPEEGSRPLTAQMRHRAEVVRAACPELPIDTDDWRAPDLESWRAYLRIKSDLGVPSLYYASHLDATGERLTADDYEALRRTWATWKAARTAA